LNPRLKTFTEFLITILLRRMFNFLLEDYKRNPIIHVEINNQNKAGITT
jgi:hypothetical protein